MTEQYFRDLANRARQGGIYLYTDFCSMADAAAALAVSDEKDILLWGGMQDCERVMIRFGNADDAGYTADESDFPIALLRISPKQQKFADKLSHRDFLGALMNLGIERDVLGDIIVAENVGYVFAVSRIAEFLTEHLDRVKHTAVTCEVISELPEHAAPKIVSEEINVASMRLDGIVAKVFRLSRGEAKGLFSSERVFVNGRVCHSAGGEPRENDVVSVHGYGKFVFYGTCRETKKGRVVARVGRYV